jgi:hypothetical protein
MSKRDHHRFDKIIRLFERNLPLVLLMVWAIAQPQQAGDLLKLVAAFLAGKGIKVWT